MRNIKSFWFGRFAVVMAVAISATACLKEDILSIAEPMPQGKMIRFDIQRGWNDEDITRSTDGDNGKLLSNHILTSDDKSQSIEMAAYKQSNDSWFGAETKGTMVTAEAFNEFMAFGYKTTGTTTTPMFNTYHKKGGDMWDKPYDKTTGSEYSEGYPWPGAEYTCSFFGIAMSDDKLTNTDFYSNVTTTTNDAGQIVSFDYTVPDAAVDQPDIMVASATNLAGDGSQGATLNFKHILTAINIKVGTATVGSDITGITINSITFNNIYGKASYTLETSAWTNAVYYDVQKSYSVDFNGSGDGLGTFTYESGSNADITGTGATMMLLPQTLRNDATITVSYTLTGNDIDDIDRSVTSVANIGGTTWEPGKVINYVLNIDNRDGVQFLTQDTYVDAHYIILPLNIKYQNPGGTVTLRAVEPETSNQVDWVQFRQNLVEVENDGWWADPENVYEVDDDGNTAKLTNNDYLRENSLTVSSAGQCFAFLTENITSANRAVELQLLIGDAVKHNISITQFCPTWDEAGTKGCERIEEGESLPWGYSWKLKEGQEDYKIIVTYNGNILGDFFTRIWIAIVNLLYGSPGTLTSGWNSSTYTFDYSSFINNMSDPDSGAGSTTNGINNSTYMFSYNAADNMIAFQEWLLTNFPNKASITTETFEGVQYTEYATKEALKKNKVTVYTGSTGGESLHNPIIESTRTDLWYLPATGEVNILQNNTNMIEGVETMMNNGDIFWTSTAAETPLAYMYTFGGATATADRDNAYRVRAIRNISTTN